MERVSRGFCIGENGGAVESRGPVRNLTTLERLLRQYPSSELAVVDSFGRVSPTQTQLRELIGGVPKEVDDGEIVAKVVPKRKKHRKKKETYFCATYLP
jgi:hypothetical protein